jgi:hypothetical protein
MRLLFTLLLNLIFIIGIQAGTLVLIPTQSLEKTRFYFDDQSLKIHYYNDFYLIATASGGICRDFKVLDENPWEDGYGYYIVYTEKGTAKSEYISEISCSSKVLFDGGDFIIVKTNEQKHGLIQPAKNDGMVRIFNHLASLPKAEVSFSTKSIAFDQFVSYLLEEVSGSNISTSVLHLQNYTTRNAYTSQSVAAGQWIATTFEGMGLSVEIMDFNMPYGAASDNIIATQMGTDNPNEFIIIGGHYDSYSKSGDAPGADDNASGTAAVIEIARILSQYDFSKSIVYCAFSGEEYGLYGSKAYAYRCRQEEKNILGYFNLDMIGYQKPGNSFQTTLIYPQAAKPLADFYTSICTAYLPNFSILSGVLSGGDSDHTAFNINGYMGIFPFENINAYSPYIHTSNDIVGLSYNSEDQAAVFAKATLASVATMAVVKQSDSKFDQQVFGVYPNPSSNFIRISFSGVDKVLLEVFNLQGQLMSSKNIAQNEEVNVSGWEKGVYIFKISNSLNSEVKRIIVQ